MSSFKIGGASWGLEETQPENFALERFNNGKHTIYHENDYYQIVCTTYYKRGIMTFQGQHLPLGYDAARSEVRYYLVDKEEKAIVMKCHWGKEHLKSDAVNHMCDVMERRTQEKLQEIDNIILEE